MESWQRKLGIVLLAVVLVGVCYYFVDSQSYSKIYSGEFYKANKIYMPEGNIKLVLYFNESDTVTYVIFDSWKPEHSVRLSNIEEGANIKLHYKEYYMLRDVRELVRIEEL